MKKKFLAFCILTVLTICITTAQTTDPPAKKQQAIKASVGFGISVPYDDDADFYGQGFFAQAEYVYSVTKWFDIRPYAGFILSSSDENTTGFAQRELTADMNAFLLGGKVRIKAPIRWVAPFIEIGVGMSVGEFETVTNTIAIEESGLIFHIPFSVGLALGPKHNFEIAFTYYYHNSIDQFAGAAAFGITFPLN
ncbi:MAG: outer membrane beta-barrel protein [Bacteroidota bacterium]